MLACARIGADPLGGVRRLLARRARRPHRRLRLDASSSPPTRAVRGGKTVPLKANVDEALARTAPAVEKVLVVDAAPAAMVAMDRRPRRAGSTRPSAQVSDRLPAEPMDAEDPLFILYTSGSTGKPKGVLHTTGGYLVCAALTHKYVFDLPRRRHLLVHGRRRLGHRPQLHRLRPARQRRHHADVRGRAQLPGREPLLAGRRQAQGQHLLHRADRHPRADAARATTPVKTTSPQVAAPARHGRRADQSRGLAAGTTTSSARAAARSSTPGGRPRPAAS